MASNPLRPTRRRTENQRLSQAQGRGCLVQLPTWLRLALVLVLVILLLEFCCAPIPVEAGVSLTQVTEARSAIPSSAPKAGESLRPLEEESQS